ncbi:FAD:protein FMN transferase [Marinicella pacifica]|uniref:FAD:protein FMN transferase n=1 Tax=Marinicella pacifica TaxID=1171543 RepID=A0A917CMM2_9GAMM|nr:FAD:protein FMN transferase [Marinicella pacifica]GGF92751.1 FAD:protein FMN transferase [Marinicella pacifica]
MIKKLTLPLIVLFLCACFQPQYNNYQRQIFVFGTLVNINIWHHNANQAEQAINDIDDLFKNMHHQWHAWKPGRLHDINNALRAGNAIQLTPDEATFIQQVMSLAKQSNHHFNPAIGELINLWGFHTDDYPITTPPPSPESIKELAEQQLTVDHLQLNNLTLSSTNRHIWLDFGGIAKGLAVDQAIAIIRGHGIDNAIVNAGGDLRSIGSKGDRAWRIGIQSPKNQSMLAEIQINQDESVFTSGNYQRYKAFDGKRYAHIIDGRSGLPVQGIISATVIAEDGVTADAAATALIVAGNENWQQVANTLQLNKILLINKQNQCLATKDMYQRLKNLTSPCQIISL